VAETNYIRKIVINTGLVTTLAASGAAGITTDGTNLYLSGGMYVSQVVIANGAVTYLAGSGGRTGSYDGIGGAAKFNGAAGITTDGTSLYVAEASANKIRKIQ
jgi:uncharacterized protein YfaQ (DUF2300 family)